MQNGKLITKDNENILPDLPDCDGEIRDASNSIYALITMKFTEGDGHAQDQQFRDVKNFIDHSPVKNTDSNIWSICYVGGNFWTRKRPIRYKNYFQYFGLPKGSNILDVLNAIATNKQVIVLTKDKLPKKTMSFIDYCHINHYF